MNRQTVLSLGALLVYLVLIGLIFIAPTFVGGVAILMLGVSVLVLALRATFQRYAWYNLVVGGFTVAALLLLLLIVVFRGEAFTELMDMLG